MIAADMQNNATAPTEYTVTKTRAWFAFAMIFL